MEENNENRLEELYLNFKEELRHNSSNLYFDESELVDIFDYAGDVNDDYVRLQVLMLGNRCFPNSEGLSQRQAIFLMKVNHDAARTIIESRDPSEDDVMWSMLRLRVGDISASDVPIMLDFILDKGLSDDESIIQFVAMVKEASQEQWLIDNFDRIRRNCDDAPTLLYEVARLADNYPMIDLGITLMEELTMEYPFNSDYWTMLADLQVNRGLLEDARSSLDYAKALRPDDDELRNLEAFIEMKTGNADHAVELMKGVVERRPDNYPALRNLYEAYKANGNAEGWMPMVDPLFKLEPSDSNLLLEHLSIHPESSTHTLDLYYHDVAPTEENVMQHVELLINRGDYATALTYLNWYRTNFDITQTVSFKYLELLYRNDRIKEAYDYICAGEGPALIKPEELGIIGIIASVLIKQRLYEDALEFIHAWQSKLCSESLRRSAAWLTIRGLIATLSEMEYLIMSGNFTEEAIESVTL